MAKWGRLESKVINTFNLALARKGYLSLCSIIESQYYIPRTYPINLMKCTHLAVVNRPENKGRLPQQYNIVKYRIEYQQKIKRRQAYAISNKLKAINTFYKHIKE